MDKKYDMDVYRCKGVLSVVNSDELHMVQGIYEIVPARKWRSGEKQMNKILFIDKLINDRELHLLSSRRLTSLSKLIFLV
ncbi:putative cobalamin (vitamin B12) biosynthesis CobW-like, cobW-like domain superfamily [Helianthus anomalus]